MVMFNSYVKLPEGIIELRSWKYHFQNLLGDTPMIPVIFYLSLRTTAGQDGW